MHGRGRNEETNRHARAKPRLVYFRFDINTPAHYLSPPLCRLATLISYAEAECAFQLRQKAILRDFHGHEATLIGFSPLFLGARGALMRSLPLSPLLGACTAGSSKCQPIATPTADISRHRSMKYYAMPARCHLTISSPERTKVTACTPMMNITYRATQYLLLRCRHACRHQATQGTASSLLCLPPRYLRRA